MGDTRRVLTSVVEGATSIAFEENQLSPSLISLSLQSTTHPNLFQQIPVRASSRYYPTFTLVMDRSPGFGSTPSDCRPIQTRFPYASPIRLSLPLKVSR